MRMIGQCAPTPPRPDHIDIKVRKNIGVFRKSSRNRRTSLQIINNLKKMFSQNMIFGFGTHQLKNSQSRNLRLKRVDSCLERMTTSLFETLFKKGIFLKISSLFSSLSLIFETTSPLLCKETMAMSLLKASISPSSLCPSLFTALYKKNHNFILL